MEGVREAGREYIYVPGRGGSNQEEEIYSSRVEEEATRNF